MYVRIKTGTLFTQYVVTKGDPSSWRMKEKRKVYQRRRYLALRKIDVIAAAAVLQVQRPEMANCTLIKY